MQFPTACREILLHIAGEEDRFPSADLDEIARDGYLRLQDLLQIATVPLEEWRREWAIVAVWRAVLALLPAAVLEKPEQPCRDAVHARLTHLLGTPPAEEDLGLIMKVVKRMQLFRMGGRRALHASSFDLSLSSHRELVRKQSNRCRICGYYFHQEDLDPDPSKGEHPNINTPLGVVDRSPQNLRRKAVLDHVFPIYLAGDRSENWQILCFSCNSGKSDMFFGFETRAWFGGARLQDLTSVTTKEFYMVLYRDRCCSRCSRTSLQTELRVIRKDPNGPDLYTNLTACCVDCCVRTLSA